MRQVPIEELIGLFDPPEGGIALYYGRIGSGKTYSATADVLELLSQGRVVYTNWRIDYLGFDETKSRKHLFFKFLFGKRFYKFPKENLRYFDPDKANIEELSKITDADVFIDEGQWIFDSYEGTKFSVEKRRLILHTRHLNRSLNIITQRPQAVQVSARGQVNVFYKCEKKMSWPFLIFKRTEFQEMKDNDVDEDSEPVSTKVYFARKRILESYNTHYLRGDIKESQRVFVDAVDLNLFERLGAFLTALGKRGRNQGYVRSRASQEPTEGVMRVEQGKLGEAELT